MFSYADLKGEQISAIGCGTSHTLVGTSTGQLFAFGSNSDHQCGLDEGSIVATPTEVELDERIVFKQLCGGSCHSVGLDSELYQFTNSDMIGCVKKTLT